MTRWYSSTRMAVADSAVNDKLHAAVAQHRAVGQRIAELHLRRAAVCGSAFGMTTKA